MSLPTLRGLAVVAALAHGLQVRPHVGAALVAPAHPLPPLDDVVGHRGPGTAADARGVGGQVARPLGAPVAVAVLATQALGPALDAPLSTWPGLAVHRTVARACDRNATARRAGGRKPSAALSRHRGRAGRKVLRGQRTSRTPGFSHEFSGFRHPSESFGDGG